MTIAEEITYFENEITETQEKIKKIRHLKSIEEGSAGSRFVAQYTELPTLRADEKSLKARLNTLEGYNL